MSVIAAQQKYAEIRQKIADAKKQMEETAKGLFNEMSAELFNDNPTLVSFSWTQYTPYWNDGDVCEFRCQGEYPTVAMLVDGKTLQYDSNRGEMTIDGKESETADEHVRTFKSMRVDSFSKNGKNYVYDAKTGDVTVDGVRVPTYEENRAQFDDLEKVVASFMRNFEDDDMETMFGDHMRVTVHRGGNIELEEYQHD